MKEEGVSFHLESLLAQDNVDSGDKTTWSRLRVTQIREVNSDGFDDWLKGVEYAVPRPPKKPG